MTKNLTDILTEGFELWKKNLILGVPPVLNWVIQSALWFAIVVVITVSSRHRQAPTGRSSK